MLKAFEEVRRAPDAAAAFEMALVRLCAMFSDMPGPDVLLKRLQSGEPLTGPQGPGGGGGAIPGGGGTAQAVRAQPAQLPNPQSFGEVLALIDAKRDIGLRTDVEQFVRLIAFRPGAITFELAPRAPGDLVRKLSLRLKEWTGQRWLIATEGSGGAETVIEQRGRERAEFEAKMELTPFVAAIRSTFPDAQVTVRPKAKPVGPVLEEAEDNSEKDDE